MSRFFQFLDVRFMLESHWILALDLLLHFRNFLNWLRLCWWWLSACPENMLKKLIALTTLGRTLYQRLELVGLGSILELHCSLRVILDYFRAIECWIIHNFH